MCYWQMHIYLSIRSVLYKCKIKTQELINLMHALIRLFVVSQNPESSSHWLEQNQEPGPSHIKKQTLEKKVFP